MPDGQLSQHELTPKANVKVSPELSLPSPVEAGKGLDEGGHMNADRDDIRGPADVEERLRAAADSAREEVSGRMTERGNGRAYRARQAREWARSHWSDLQDRVERRPYSASAWALGIGFITGIILTSMLRSRRD